MTSPAPLRYDVWPTVIANLDMYMRFQLFERCPGIRHIESVCPAKIDTLCFNLTNITMGKISFQLDARYRSITISEDKPKKLEFKTQPSSEFEALKRMAMKLLGRYSNPVIVGKLSVSLFTHGFLVTMESTYLPPTLKITSRSLNVTTLDRNSEILRYLTPDSFPLENLQLDTAIEWGLDYDCPIITTAKNLKIECEPRVLYNIKIHKVQVILWNISLFNPITLIATWRREQAEVGRHFRLNGFNLNETRRVLDVVKEFPGVVKGTREDDSESSVFPECFTLEISDEKKLIVFGKQYLSDGYSCYEVHFKIAQILNDIA